jgi:hypothetical protein
MSRTECPICGGRLLATVEEYRNDVVVSDDFSQLVDGGDDDGVGDWRVYCENDHTEEDMKVHIANQENPNEPTTR